ncbi:protein kinase [Streptacidiphilus sp. EB129]|uniref:serine/threonine-protein kinase n=1 Tax=Streptacidiphilus sp. EB129 TaxID=3156262 RepID=UPI0035141995
MRPVGSKYLLEEPLGRGATGTVWRALVRDEGTGGPTGQQVAIKVLKEELAQDPDVVMRFLRERSVLLRLVHPNIVRIRDLVVEGELLALVMDLVDGPDLHRYLRAHGPLSPVAGSLLMAQIADALAASHADGVVHRDLKPANVLLATVRTEDGGERMHPLLTDFGIARLADSPGLTRTHEFVGTPAYIAPESAEGRPQSEAVDIYGAGIMLYELSTGRPPFHGDGPLQILQAHLSQEPERPRNLPEPLWSVIEACLRKDPSQRPDAVLLATALRTVAAGVGVHATPARIDAALAVAELLAPAPVPFVPGSQEPTLPRGMQFDPGAPTVFAGGGTPFGAADPTAVLPAGAAERTQLLPPGGGRFGSADPTRMPAPGAAAPTTAMPQFGPPQSGAQSGPQSGAPQPGMPGAPSGAGNGAQPPAGPHPWESQLRAARTRNEQTRVDYQFPPDQQSPQGRPQVAPPPYRAAPQQQPQSQQPQQPQYRNQPGTRPQRAPEPLPYPGESEGFQPEPYRPEPPPEPRRGRGGRSAPERIPERAPEPEPRREREPRAPRPRRRMRIPGSGCLRFLVVLAVLAVLAWYFTPLQHWIQNVQGWWHQAVDWWHQITGTAQKIKNGVPKVPNVNLPTPGN